MNNNTFDFSADIDQLMSLIVNAFYSKKDVFLRELLSNSSDALEKYRFHTLQNTCNDDEELKIKISYSLDNKTITIQDNGIGMTKEDLINNLGTVAKSGTKAFIDSLKEKKDVNQIGQFGVGFYSAFLVADRVDVITKNNSDKHYIWSSDAKSSYTINECNDEINRGTKIILHLKEEDHDFLSDDVISNLVKSYSQYIQTYINK